MFSNSYRQIFQIGHLDVQTRNPPQINGMKATLDLAAQIRSAHLQMDFVTSTENETHSTRIG